MSKHHAPWTKQNAPVNLNEGPNTQEGKEISSRNALKHGSCSLSTLILPNEFEAELIRAAVRAEPTCKRYPITDKPA